MNNKKTDGIGWAFNDAAIVDDKMYFLAKRKMYYIDMKTWETFYAMDLKDNVWLKEHWVAYMEAVGQRIFLFAKEDCCTAIYDCGTGKLTQIYEKKGALFSIFEILKNQDKVFVFRKDKCFIQIFHKDGTIEQQPYAEEIDPDKAVTLKSGDKFFVFHQGDSFYWTYHLEKMKWERKEMPFKLQECIAGGMQKEKVYFLLSESVIIWDFISEPKTIPIEINDIKKPGYGLIYPLMNKMILLPKTADDIYEISYDGSVRKYNDYPEDYHYTRDEKWREKGNKFYLCEIINGIYYFSRRTTNYILTINANREEFEWISTERTSLADYIKYWQLENSPIKEGRFNLQNYLDMIILRRN